MKKLLSIILTMTMFFSLSMTAFATENTSLTIEDSDGREYVGYQLLKLTTSLKEDEHHTDHTGDHTNDCYNYAYTLNTRYETVLQEEVFNKGGNYLWDDTPKPTTASGIKEPQILKYLANQTSDDGDVYHTMRQVADRLYRAIKEANITPDADNLNGTGDNIEQGYWMIADVTDLNGHDANSLVMVDTKGQDALVITPKTALPTIEKKVKDIDDSEDDSITDNAWHDSADHDLGNRVPFKLTATLPSNFRAYIVRDESNNSIHPYELIFHDTLSEGLTLDENSIRVYMYDTVYKASVDTDVNDYKADVTDSFDVTTSGITDGCSFEVACEDVIDITDVTKDSAFVVYYEATLNENAVMGSAGNTNNVYLEFSNDPYGDGRGTTEEDTVTVYTYQLIINKTDSHGHALKGAGFTLYKKALSGEYNPVSAELKGADMTTFNWTHLDDGDYKLSETTVPEGYNKLSDILFSISAVHTDTDGESELVSLDGGQMGTGVVGTGAITKDIVNNTGTILPETGARGTIMLIGFSSMLVLVAAVFMVTRKKMSIYED